MVWFKAGKDAASDKAMRKLSRKDLLRLLVEQMEENDRLREELAAAQEELASRKIVIEKAGSLAEASVLLAGVLEAAEEASTVYIQNIKRMEAELRERVDERDARSTAQDGEEQPGEVVRGKHASR